jgi:hypothetical protein
VAILTPQTSLPWIDDSPDAWDSVTVAGMRLPGLCVVDAKRVNRVDHKTEVGVTGSAPTVVGWDSCTIKLTWRIWLGLHLNQAKGIVHLLAPHRANAKPVDFYHPSTAELGIKSVLLDEIGNWKLASASEGRVLERVISFKEWTRLAAKVETSKVSITDGIKGAFSTGPATRPTPPKKSGP